MLEVERYYRTLELEPGASLEEIHQGYIDLTWVWHPDRFVGNPRLQQKAHHKLQQLNEAHERLRSFQVTSRKKDLHVKPKSQPSPKSYNQPFTKGLRKPEVNQTRAADNTTAVKDSRHHISFKSSDVAEWLD